MIATIMLGTVMLGFAGNFWLNEKRTLLTNEAQTVALQMSDMLGTVGYDRYMDKIVETLTKMSGSDVLIASSDGVIIYSGSNRFDYTGKVVPKEIMDTALKQVYTEMGNLQGVLIQDSYLVGVPISYTLGSVGVVFAVTPSAGLMNYLLNMLKLFLLASLLVTVLVFIAVYLMTNNMVRPMREMAEAARCMARGDFSRQIRVDREDEVGELAVAFNNMTKSIAAGEQMRRGFIANVSHELKTPMTTISGFIDGILDGTISEKEQKFYLEIVSGEVKRLSRLVVSMLSLSKLEAGEMTIHPAPMKLSELLVSILFGFDRRIEEKNLEIVGLDTVGSLEVTADHDLMHQAIYNLVDNAIKYTPAGGTIWFRGWEENNEVTLAIRNSGKGIAKKELSHVFERFYKVDKSRGTDKMGAGLGLYLVKTIISLHGGQITVRSVEGQYTEFSFTLTAHRRPPERSEGKERREHKDRREHRDGKERDGEAAQKENSDDNTNAGDTPS